LKRAPIMKTTKSPSIDAVMRRLIVAIGTIVRQWLALTRDRCFWASTRWGCEATGPLKLGTSVILDFAGNTVSDRRWMRSIFERAAVDHRLHYILADVTPAEHESGGEMLRGRQVCSLAS
jgi:hypothetical protein